MLFDDLFANRQPQARAGKFLPRMEPLEDHKNPLGVLWLHPNALVPHRHLSLGAPALGPQMDARGGPRVKLQPIPKLDFIHGRGFESRATGL